MLLWEGGRRHETHLYTCVFVWHLFEKLAWQWHTLSHHIPPSHTKKGNGKAAWHIKHFVLALLHSIVVIDDDDDDVVDVDDVLLLIVPFVVVVGKRPFTC